jgi:hypothetical protein
MGHPTIYPTGVTVYNKDLAWNGYTIFPSPEGALLIDMNGREVHRWKGLLGENNKLLPGGAALGSSGTGSTEAPGDYRDLVLSDWDGNILWRFDKTEYTEKPGESPWWSARLHRDYQQEGAGVYYAPGTNPKTSGGNTLLIVHHEVYDPAVSGKTLLDSRIIEVNRDGTVLWQWNAHEHFEELGFDEGAKNCLYRLPASAWHEGGGGYWLGINSIATLGSNQWYDGGDTRFHPDNIILSARNANILAVIDKKTGEVVFRLGPDFSKTDFGWIIGPHHFHLIPRGLPGEGNLLVFDNGGSAGYGVPNGVSRYGTSRERRDYSRILEIDPISLQVAWQYTPKEAGHIHPLDSYKFFSPFNGSVQRLPNGNTLITEGSDGRIFEVSPQYKTVWEYLNPYYSESLGGTHNLVYRAYRVPYAWIPQLPEPSEKSIVPPDRGYRGP